MGTDEALRPVFVMTHHLRPTFALSDTTFHFVDGDPLAVLEQAREAAGGKDVRLSGGATTIRQFLDADLVDTMHGPCRPDNSAPAFGCGSHPTNYSTGSMSMSSLVGAA